MPSISKSPWACAGTKRVSISGYGGEFMSSMCDGMMSIYYYSCRLTNVDGNDTIQRSPIGSASTSDDDDGRIHVLIADGIHTYFKCIHRKDIRHIQSDNGKELEKVTSILLGGDDHDDQSFKVNYKRVECQILGGSLDSKNTTSVLVSIRKTCLNNIVRTVWEGQFDDICHSHHDDLPIFLRRALTSSTATSKSSSLAFPVVLGETVNELHKEIEELRSMNKRLDENTLLWKSTAEKLSNQWETEKSELTERFLILFNDHKARHAETRKELEQLKGKKQRTDGTVSNRLGYRKSRDLMPDDEDEHDYVTYKNKEVDRLAEGRRSSTQHGKKPSLSQTQSACSGFVNPHTGAMEYSNPKELFSSDEDDDMEMES